MAALAGCGKPQVARGINDPYETHNRAVHELNRDIDRTLLKPASSGVGSALPEPARRGISNFAGNFGLPSSIVNDLLQANIDDAASNTVRLLINTTFGLGGILDPATAWGLPARDTDFGETLHVWGFAEGHYVELPLLGPSTKRDAIGGFVDLFTNPLSYILPSPKRYAGPVAGAVSKVGDRDRFGDTIDSILYDSADSYAQARLLYLESRRFKLGGGNSDSTYDGYDDYDDFYSE
ncbi:MAG: VacJ family lipoprotein [Rhodobacter sp.]|nr:VacJ family lipoprotein [Rhodobacter sp.]